MKCRKWFQDLDEEMRDLMELVGKNKNLKVEIKEKIEWDRK